MELLLELYSFFSSIILFQSNTLGSLLFCNILCSSFNTFEYIPVGYIQYLHETLRSQYTINKTHAKRSAVT